MHPGEVFWAASDVGWVVGHSYIVYAPLIYGCTTLLYEGKTGSNAGCRGFLAGDQRAPGWGHVHRSTAFRAIRKEDPRARGLKRYDLSHWLACFRGR